MFNAIFICFKNKTTAEKLFCNTHFWPLETPVGIKNKQTFICLSFLAVQLLHKVAHTETCVCVLASLLITLLCLRMLTANLLMCKAVFCPSLVEHKLQLDTRIIFHFLSLQC